MSRVGDKGQDDLKIEGLRPSASESVTGAEQVAGATEVESSEAVSAVGGDLSTDSIAEALASGEISAAEAQAQLIEEVVRAQLPDDAPPEVVESVRAEVGELLAGDPTLRNLLQA